MRSCVEGVLVLGTETWNGGLRRGEAGREKTERVQGEKRRLGSGAVNNNPKGGTTKHHLTNSEPPKDTVPWFSMDSGFINCPLPFCSTFVPCHVLGLYVLFLQKKC